MSTTTTKMIDKVILKMWLLVTAGYFQRKAPSESEKLMGFLLSCQGRRQVMKPDPTPDCISF